MAILTILLTLFAVLWAGLSRALVGSGKYFDRGWAYPLAAALAVLAGPQQGLEWNSLWCLPFFLAAMLTHMVGIDDWDDKEYMAGHLAWMPTVAMACYALSGDSLGTVLAAGWATACLIVGWFYGGMLQALREPLLVAYVENGETKYRYRRIGQVDLSPQPFVEFLAGAVVIGGVALVKTDGPSFPGPLLGYVWYHVIPKIVAWAGAA